MHSPPKPDLPTTTSKVKIAAGKLFDPYRRRLLEHQIITVNTESGLIEDVRPVQGGVFNLDFTDTKSIIDLRQETVLAGFVDAHVHFFLHAYSETSWNDQVTKESIVERTVRATVHAKKTLLAGYTAVRDLGTEGAEDADIHLRKCISGQDALIPGPRYFCANRAIVCTGSYGPKSSIHVHQEGVEGMIGAQVADGKDECVKAVRTQIGAGADWIKIYGDYSVRSRLSGVSASAASYIPTFSPEELKVMIDTAHYYGVKVAAHAMNNSTIQTLLGAGVDTIEHGSSMEYSSGLSESHAIWVPTLAVYYTLGKDSERWKQAAQKFKNALVRGGEMRIACGGDTGAFSHGENALEMKLMVQLGADWRDVLTWGTLSGWECIRSMRWEGPEGMARLRSVEDLKEDPRTVGDNEVAFGAVRRGFVADIIATCGDLESDFENAVSANHISFVMKGGKVYKMNGVGL